MMKNGAPFQKLTGQVSKQCHHFMAMYVISYISFELPLRTEQDGKEIKLLVPKMSKLRLFL